jgi:hypothetical protein
MPRQLISTLTLLAGFLLSFWVFGIKRLFLLSKLRYKEKYKFLKIRKWKNIQYVFCFFPDHCVSHERKMETNSFIQYTFIELLLYIRYLVSTEEKIFPGGILSKEQGKWPLYVHFSEFRIKWRVHADVVVLGSSAKQWLEMSTHTLTKYLFCAKCYKDSWVFSHSWKGNR